MNLLSDSIIPIDIQRELPFAVNAQVASLPEEVQREFLQEYRRRAKNIIIPYILHFFVPAHYLYLDKLVMQLLFWFTLGGLGLWWFIDIFRIPSLVKRRNAEIADEVLRDLLLRHGKKQTRQKATVLDPQPRPLNVAFDPTRITLDNLQVGYLLDYGLKTWQVVNQIQYDWNDGTSEREYKLLSENEVLYLSLWREGALLECRIGRAINVYAIDTQLDIIIQREGTPPSFLRYADFALYREKRYAGYAFNQAQGNKAVKIVAWDYMDKTHTYHLRIACNEYQNFFALFSKRVSEIEFSEILPKSQ